MRRKTFIAAGAVTFAGVPSAAKATALSNNGPGFEQFRDYPYDVAFNRKKRVVYAAGTGPPVLVLHELFGATPELFKFAYRIASAGFSAYVPILFGTANRHSDAIYDIQQILHVCISKEFALFDAHRSSPITSWLRGLGRRLHDDFGGRGIGAVGLCLTGNFALTMMLDAHLLAPVASEPALPFLHSGKLGLEADTISAIRSRIAEGRKIMAFRFRNDSISPERRYQVLQSTFGKENVLGNGALEPTCVGAHAVFTDHFDDSASSSTMDALSQVIAFLSGALL